jgi:hypothetical protein
VTSLAGTRQNAGVRLLLFFLVLACASVAAGPVVASTPTARRASTFASFRTPSGNIGCVYSAGGGLQPALRCDIRSGLRPRPARPRRCGLDYGDSFGLSRTGRTFVVCHGDTALDPRAPVLAYGRSWKRNGFACNSRAVGLHCSNRSGHGFFMSREHSYRF